MYHLSWNKHRDRSQEFTYSSVATATQKSASFR